MDPADLTHAAEGARLRAEEELHAAEERYRRLVEQLPLTTYLTDAEGEILHVSAQIERLLGYAPAEWLARGRRLYEASIHPDDAERVRAENDRARSSSSFFRSEYRMTRKDGDVVWVQDEMAPADEPDGTVTWRGFLLDVTERKQLEERLRQSQKLEAVGQLAGGIAHDFNNMLTAISGYAELLALSFEEGDPRLDDVGELRRAADHAAALTQQLLAYSREQVLQPQLVDVRNVVGELDALLRRTLGGHIVLEKRFSDDALHVEADRDQLAQVVINLALNARDAMPAGGRLRLAVAPAELDGRPFVTIEVTDTGTGMDDETRARIFEPFFTTKGVGEGTGLGLATAYGVVSQSGGVIEVETEPGAGSTFRVLLPRATVSAAVAS